MHKRRASAYCRIRDSELNPGRRSQGVKPKQFDFREPFCAVVVNNFYERHLLFRSGRNRNL